MSAAKKAAGRPAKGVKTIQVSARVDARFVEAIDQWLAKENPFSAASGGRSWPIMLGMMALVSMSHEQRAAVSSSLMVWRSQGFAMDKLEESLK